MIMGGFETTAHTLAFTLFSISTNPQAEAAVVSELRNLGLIGIAKHSKRVLQHDDLRNMPQISNCIKEAMRMYPVVAGIPR
jgi:cytochrome P450